MKGSIKAVATVLALLLFWAPNTNAQINECNEDGINQVTGERCVNTIITAVPFLRIIPDARSGGMGDVGISISPDPNAMHFNASKLAFVDKDLGISATYTPWLRALGLQDVYLAYLSAYKRIDDLQTVGLSLRYFSLGNIQFTDENGQPLGSDRPNEFELAGAYARKLSDKFSAAITLKFIYSKLANGQSVNGQEITPGTSIAGDISFTYNTPIKLGSKKAQYTLGVAISNIGTKVSYTNSVNKDFIPTNLGIGNTLEINFDDYNSIAISVDINKLLVPTPDPLLTDNDPQDGVPDYKQVSIIAGLFKSFGDAPGGFAEELNELMYSIGVEYWYDKQFAVRFGHYNESKTKGNRKFFTAGLGLKYSIFGLNFSYLIPTSNQRNPLDNTLRFSLLFDFGAFQADEEAPTNDL
ncbi:MAG: type IX secretion system outer membrane channel protein PorV [Bacteroidota bacterium]